VWQIPWSCSSTSLSFTRRRGELRWRRRCSGCAAQTVGGPILEKGDGRSILILSPPQLAISRNGYRAEYGSPPSCCRTDVTQILFFLPSILGLLVD
jgi:hypothetical protein